VSQAYGAKNYQLCGVYLNKARFVTTIAMIPLSIISIFIRDILISLKQDPEVAYYAQQYIQTYLPGLYI
jgi:Na+-driven multidrug efflux pump